MGRDDRASSIAGIVVLSMVGLAFVAWAVAVKSPLLAVREVRVEGNVRLSAGDVEALAGVRPGVNLLTLSLPEVAARLARDPWIARARAERDLPSTLILRIEERTPLAWVADPEGGAVVAADGVVLRRRAQPKRLASVGTADEVLAPGDRPGAIDEALAIVASVEPRVRREIARTERLEAGVVLHLRSGGRVMYGEPASLEEKGAALGSILAWTGRAEVAIGYVDLRDPATPALKPAR